MNITPFPTKSPAQASLDRIQQLTDDGLQQLASAIACWNAGYAELWSGSDEEVLARFEAMGFETAVALLERHHALGSLINPILDERSSARVAAGLAPLSPLRMPLVPGRNLVIDPDTQSFAIAPSVEEPSDEE